MLLDSITLNRYTHLNQVNFSYFSVCFTEPTSFIFSLILRMKDIFITCIHIFSSSFNSGYFFSTRIHSFLYIYLCRSFGSLSIITTSSRLAAASISNQIFTIWTFFFSSTLCNSFHWRTHPWSNIPCRFPCLWSLPLGCGWSWMLLLPLFCTLLLLCAGLSWGLFFLHRLHLGSCLILYNRLCWLIYCWELVLVLQWLALMCYPSILPFSSHHVSGVHGGAYLLN